MVISNPVNSPRKTVLCHCSESKHDFHRLVWRVSAMDDSRRCRNPGRQAWPHDIYPKCQDASSPMQRDLDHPQISPSAGSRAVVRLRCSCSSTSLTTSGAALRTPQAVCPGRRSPRGTKSPRVSPLIKTAKCGLIEIYHHPPTAAGPGQAYPEGIARIPSLKISAEKFCADSTALCLDSRSRCACPE
ncbi:hypothetical protein XM38_029510 [Halomicronema hongdechloris C2206]|uniref:Uncharacterized protein n=1 Tax=Halomicronema hongdechloris C2206 TaxID=1641165 RepID=A0A1Z3HPA9_9CYAN|nr:hypothetical protein XM38_029510 [Halomicronema hongdechloris C2206]